MFIKVQWQWFLLLVIKVYLLYDSDFYHDLLLYSIYKFVDYLLDSVEIIITIDEAQYFLDI